MGNLLDKLRAYLSQASLKELEENWEELKGWNEVGVLAHDYVQACLLLKQHKCITPYKMEESSEFSLNFLV